MSEFNIQPKCPTCRRLTADNKQHCPDLSKIKWSQHCRWMKCINCGATYGYSGIVEVNFGGKE